MTIHELLNIRLNANSVTDMLQYLKESNERAKKTGVYHRLARGDGIRYSHPFACGLGEIDCRKRCVEVKG